MCRKLKVQSDNERARRGLRERKRDKRDANEHATATALLTQRSEESPKQTPMTRMTFKRDRSFSRVAIFCDDRQAGALFSCPEMFSCVRMSQAFVISPASL